MPKRNHHVPKDTEIMALHRYFVWADELRRHFEAQVSSGELAKPMTGDFDQLLTEAVRSPDRVVLADIHKFYFNPYRSYFYGAMYIVVDGWKRLGIADAKINALIRSPNTAVLERHRHGAFHYHPRIFEPKLMGFLELQGGDRWLKDLRDEFNRWFIKYYANLRDQLKKMGTDARTREGPSHQ